MEGWRKRRKGGEEGTECGMVIGRGRKERRGEMVRARKINGR
jgi:hypothetical protein